MFQCLLYSIVLEKTFIPRKEETKLTCRPACSYLAAGKKNIKVLFPLFTYGPVSQQIDLKSIVSFEVNISE